MIDSVYKEIKQKMSKTIEALNSELSKIRTGRAHPSLIESVQVDCYGSKTPLNQLASISIADSRSLLVTPWDKSTVSSIEKAILSADLGLNPIGLGNAIKVPMPSLTEDRRKDLTKVVKNEAEVARVSIRNVRRDANNKFKDMVKDKSITEDDERKAVEQVQRITNDFVKSIDGIIKEKEKDLMEI
jgi:ribosome recycling factor